MATTTRRSAGHGNYQLDTTAFLSVVGPGPIRWEENYVNVWWNGFFLGGGDTAPQNTARLTNASLTSATFSNTTGLAPGIVIRFSLEATGNVSAGSTVITKTGGAVIGASEIGRYIQLDTGNLMQIRAVSASGTSITVAPQGTIAPDGPHSFAVYETGTVTSVSADRELHFDLSGQR